MGNFLWSFNLYGDTLNYDQAIEKVKTAIQKRDFSEAEALLRALDQVYPNNSEVLFLLGEILFWQKRYDEALNYLLKAYEISKSEEIKKEIEKVEIAKKLDEAKSFENKGRLKEAKEIYLSLFESGKNQYESGYNLGMIYFKEHDYEKAEEVFKKLIKLYPEDLGFKELYLEGLILNRKYEEAKKYLSKETEETVKVMKERRPDLFCRLKINYIKPFYAFYNLSPSGRKSEREYGIELSQRIKNFSLLAKLSNVERFGLKDTQLYLELYPPLGKGRWGYLSFSFSPDASFLPRTTFGGEIFQTYKNFEFSLGYTHMNFKDSKVDIFYPGLIVYLPKDIILEEKYYYVPKTNTYSLVSSLSYELTCKFWIKYGFGFGNSAERLTAYGDLLKYTTYFHKIEGEYRVKDYLSVGLEGLYEHRDKLYNRKGLNLFLKYWW